jgi:hypothetical protein
VETAYAVTARLRGFSAHRFNRWFEKASFQADEPASPVQEVAERKLRRGRKVEELHQ